MIGWIKIDDTDVDLPVMQREGDNSYYLKHDLDGNWDDLACHTWIMSAISSKAAI